jgi:RNA polymerase sigma factor (sigma-70 family)
MSPSAPYALVDEPSDESLMSLYAGGDASAFERLYRRHEMPLWRYLRRHLGEQALADDLSQEVWFAVARHAQRYQPTAKFSTWLFTLAHHRMVDGLRARKHAPVSLDAGAGAGEDEETLLDHLEAEPQSGPLPQLESREQAAALLAAIEQLPPAQREAFLLQAEGGLEVEDIASATGVSFETAKSRLRYARGKLRQLLQEYA